MPHLNTQGVLSFLKRDINSPYKIKKFADKLKDIVCILIGCTREQLETRTFKEQELGEEWWYYKYLLHESQNSIVTGATILDKNGKPKRNPIINKKTGLQEWKFIDKDFIDKHMSLEEQEYHNVTLVKLTPRLLLQLLGTEAGRNIIHPNIWCNSLFSDYNGDVEKWVDIINYKGSYQVSSFGRVKSLDRKIVYGKDNGQYHTKKSQILKPTLSGGYETVSLSGKTFTVHSLVAKHFVEGYQEGFVVNHIDYNKTNNFYKNLEWITQEDNIKHNKTTLRGNFGESQKDAKLDSDKVLAIKKLIEDNTLSQNKIAKLFNVSPTTISDIKKGKKWNHVGKDIVKIEPILPIPVPNWIITDLRFPNEMEAIKQKNGITIRVERGLIERTGKVIQTTEHESETSLDSATFDYVINNDSTLENLIEKVKVILKKENII